MVVRDARAPRSRRWRQANLHDGEADEAEISAGNIVSIVGTMRRSGAGLVGGRLPGSTRNLMTQAGETSTGSVKSIGISSRTGRQRPLAEHQ